MRGLAVKAVATLALLMVTGACVVPDARYDGVRGRDPERRGEVVEERVHVTSVYDYPTLRLACRREEKRRWEERTVSERVAGRYRWSPGGDIGELIEGPFLFVGGLLSLRKEALHALAATLPLVNLTKNATLGDVSGTGRFEHGAWDAKSATTSAPSAGTVLELRAPDGAVLCSARTGADGTAVISVEESYAMLFGGGRAPANLVEPRSGAFASLALDGARVASDRAALHRREGERVAALRAVEERRRLAEAEMSRAAEAAAHRPALAPAPGSLERPSGEGRPPTSLAQDARDYTRDTARAAAAGWRIMNDDPQRVADRLTNDEAYRRNLEERVERLGDSSERIDGRLQRAGERFRGVGRRLGLGGE